MWLCDVRLRRLGLLRLSEWYWRAERRYGLPAGAYLSVFVHAFDGATRWDVCAFHVTFCLGPDRVHFYYHEVDETTWEPGGHTSSNEIRRYGIEPRALRDVADEVARAFAAAMGVGMAARG